MGIIMSMTLGSMVGGGGVEGLAMVLAVRALSDSCSTRNGAMTSFWCFSLAAAAWSLESSIWDALRVGSLPVFLWVSDWCRYFCDLYWSCSRAAGYSSLRLALVALV